MKEELQALLELIEETAKKYNLTYLTSCVLEDYRRMAIQQTEEGEIIDIDYMEE